MDVLHAWQQASAIVLSCPGPHRRHARSLLPLSDLALPQVFLGGESQLLAFAAAAPARARQKMFFAPLPEIFAGPRGLDAAFGALGRTPPDPARVVHLRFGSVRDSRVLKGVANAAVLAERRAAPALTTSNHPFASGTALPAATLGVLRYGPEDAPAWHAGDRVLPQVDLPSPYITADLVASPADAAALDLMSLAECDGDFWSAAAVPAARPALRGAILVPWNLAYFGGIVPELLLRLATLWQPDTKLPPFILLPFNDPGQTSVLGDAIADLRKAAPAAAPFLAQLYVARVTRLAGLAPLRKWARTAWVDGNDPESWWTQARLRASGFDPILLAADEAIWVTSDTRYGKFAFNARLPSLRELPTLLARSAAPTRR